jgi:misacylated tRNA(Ala) deacylase
MTEPLYYRDAYLRSFTSRVTETDPDAGGVALAESAFFPGGGGQLADTGVLRWQGRESAVTGMKKEEGRILHLIDGELPPAGTEIEGEIDWQRRHRIMRTHSAMHVLSGVVWRDYGAKVTGGSMDILAARMDFEFENFSAELTREIEARVNKEIARGRAVRAYFLPREEAEQLPELIRTKVNLLSPELTEIRVVEIEGLDKQADGGTHVADISEIGTFAITGHKSKGKINKRLKVEIRDTE